MGARFDGILLNKGGFVQTRWVLALGVNRHEVGVAAEESHRQRGGCSMDSLREAVSLLDGWGLVGLAIHGFTPHGNRYCRAFGVSRWDASGQVGQ